MSKGLISKAGGLFKAGVIIANCKAVTAAARQGEAIKRLKQRQMLLRSAKTKRSLTSLAPGMLISDGSTRGER